MGRCKTCGRPIADQFQYCRDCNPNIANRGGLPKNYLEKGYFDSDGYIYEDLLTTTAEEVARAFGISTPKLTNSQLRRFYGHAVAAEERLTLTGQFKAANSSVQKLRAYVAEALGKQKVPPTFYDFIKTNTENVKDDKSLKQGFMEHFEAVVAYYSYLYPRN